MRWIVSIVTTLCLLAATSERPDPRAHRGDASQLTAAKLGASASPVRRAGSPRAARVDTFVTSGVLALPVAPDHVLALATAGHAAPAHDARPRTIWIRGPPRV